MAIQLADGRVITGKTSNLLDAASAATINALKAMADIPKETKLISPDILKPVSNLKIKRLGNKSPRLHLDEVLIALSICAVQDKVARKALGCLDKLTHCDAHSTVILSPADESTLKKLGVQLTCEPQYQTTALYHE